MNEVLLVATRDMSFPYTVTFINSEKEVGKLDFSGDTMIFHGEAQESAKVFFDCLGHHFDSKIKSDLTKIQNQLNIAIGMLSTHPQFENKHPEEVLEIIKNSEA